jgi:GNAT superfamily N-acetyltransferase
LPRIISSVKFSEPITIVGVEVAVADGFRVEAEAEAGTAAVLQTAAARARALVAKRVRGRGIGLVLLEGGRSAWTNPRCSAALSTSRARGGFGALTARALDNSGPV